MLPALDAENPRSADLRLPGAWAVFPSSHATPNPIQRGENNERLSSRIDAATCCVMAMAQSTPMVTAANKLQADIAKALPASTLSADEKSQITADATQLVTNANLRAKGETPDRSAGRAAGMDISKKVSSGKLQKTDAELIQQDLKALQAAAQQ